MNREKAEKLLFEHLKNPNLRRHCLATEAVMGALAERLGGDRDGWALAGLLHDIDYEETKETPDKHGLVSAEILKEHGLPEDVVNAVLAHNFRKEPQSLMENAIVCADAITGMIVASALIRPEKKISALTADFVARKMKEPSFARGADRSKIAYYEKLGLTKEEFFEIAIKAMAQIAGRLGL
ncbi:MAG: phosphohydrolase [Planctomycetota bacterium]|nr:MAG: phosphohydrolase [Planctomycetota bacterium]